MLKSEKPVVVDFWATWCGPCKMVAPEMEKLAEKYEGTVDVVKVDVDANPAISQAFQIMSIPTIAFFRPGQQPQGVVGFRPLEQLEQQFGLEGLRTQGRGSQARLTLHRARRGSRHERPGSAGAFRFPQGSWEAGGGVDATTFGPAVSPGRRARRW